MATEKVSRCQPWVWVMGSSHRPKPCLTPMDRVTIRAPQTMSWAMGRALGREELVMYEM